MCEITARVAVALKCAVEESAQTREAVALLNDQAFKCNFSEMSQFQDTQ